MISGIASTGSIWHWQTLAAAHQKSWSEIQPLLVNANAPAALDVATSILGSKSESDDDLMAGIEFCRERLGWPRESLDPPPLLDGKDLIRLGILPGPEFKSLLQSVRDSQLDGKIETVDQAKKFVLGKI